jgi:hypothetical protein
MNIHRNDGVIDDAAEDEPGLLDFRTQGENLSLEIGIIPAASSDDRFLRGNRQGRPALCPSEKGQWSGPLV